MKVYKIFYIWQDEKVYLRNTSKTEIFTTLKGAKAAISYRERLIKHYGNTPTTEYFIEEYKCDLLGVWQIKTN